MYSFSLVNPSDSKINIEHVIGANPDILNYYGKKYSKQVSLSRYNSILDLKSETTSLFTEFRLHDWRSNEIRMLINKIAKIHLQITVQEVKLCMKGDESVIGMNLDCSLL